jgi:hypothetical protein
MHMSQSVYGPGNFGDWPANNVANHNVTPGAIYSNTNFKANLDVSIVNIGASVTPNYGWGNNVLIGGYLGDTLQTITDLPYSSLMSIASNMPTGDIYPAGDTMAARQSAAGLDLTTWESSVYNPIGIGADISLLNSALGRVTGVLPVAPTGTTALFVYTAPDTRQCAVDISAAGVIWQRTEDGGGRTARKVTIKGLSNGTQYQSRILSYYQQQNDGVLYTDYTPDQITVANFTTAATGR